MFRVIETDMTDEIYEIAYCAMQAVHGPYGNLDFVNFILPSPVPYSWELDFQDGPMADEITHGTVDTRAVTITPDLYARQGLREIGYPPCEVAYHVTYGEHDFYFVPGLLKLYVKPEKADGG